RRLLEYDPTLLAPGERPSSEILAELRADERLPPPILTPRPLSSSSRLWRRRRHCDSTCADGTDGSQRPCCGPRCFASPCGVASHSGWPRPAVNFVTWLTWMSPAICWTKPGCCVR